MDIFFGYGDITSGGGVAKGGMWQVLTAKFNKSDLKI